MRYFFPALLLLAVLGGCTTTEQAGTATRPPLAERAASCMLCHSGKESQRGPILNGVDVWYLEAQLGKFKKGIRGHNPTNRTEQLMASTMDLILTKKDIKELARYMHAQEAVLLPAIIKGDAEKGARIYGAHCVNCHGEGGEGKRILKSPPLVYFEDWYIYAQLQKFKSGRRGGHEDDKTGQTMAASVQALSIEELRDVSVYIRQSLAPLKISSESN
jgi:cytochrome c oxidase subunit 2